MSTWIAVVAVGLGSYLLRAVPLLVLDRARPSARMEATIGRAGLAAITALIVVSAHRTATASGAPATLAAVAAGAVVARRQAPMLAVVAAGSAVYAATLLGLTALA